MLKFEQYYLDCLSHASYLIGDTGTGRAAVVDPRRDVDIYLGEAAASDLTIDFIIETHFHADFVSGHLELATQTGATIAFGEAATTEFPSLGLQHGERLSLGDVTLEIRATPGHTPESISIVIYEHADDDQPYGVLTGDTLFIGDVGRPDLLASAGARPEDMARDLYTSIHEQLLTLPDSTRVFPAHGAGSSCGRNLSTETQSTIGEQRRGNYALQIADIDEFAAAVTADQPPQPDYFAHDAELNRSDHRLHDETAPDPLSIEEVLAAQAERAIVLDTRPVESVARGTLDGAVNVGLDGRFAEYAGTVIDPGRSIVVIAEPGRESEAKTRLARIGFDDVVGHLRQPTGELADHPQMARRASRLTATALRERLDGVDDIQIVDVRAPGEIEDGMITGAVSMPLPILRSQAETLDPDRPTVVYCAGGYRSSIARSWLAANGFTDVSDLVGGHAAWTNDTAI